MTAEFSLIARYRKYWLDAQKNINNEYCRFSAESEISEGEKQRRARPTKAVVLSLTLCNHRNMIQQNVIPPSTEGSRKINSESPKKRQKYRSTINTGGCAVVRLA